MHINNNLAFDLALGRAECLRVASLTDSQEDDAAKNAIFIALAAEEGEVWPDLLKLLVVPFFLFRAGISFFRPAQVDAARATLVG
jgi:hypothetical protein